MKRPRRNPAAMAERLARWAHNDAFSFRRIVDVDERADVTYYGNNNPYRPEAGGTELRNTENDVIAKRAAERGVRLLASAAYPRGGEESGYTSMMVFEGADSFDLICDLVSEYSPVRVGSC